MRLTTSEGCLPHKRLALRKPLRNNRARRVRVVAFSKAAFLGCRTHWRRPSRCMPSTGQSAKRRLKMHRFLHRRRLSRRRSVVDKSIRALVSRGNRTLLVVDTRSVSRPRSFRTTRARRYRRKHKLRPVSLHPGNHPLVQRGMNRLNSTRLRRRSPGTRWQGAVSCRVRILLIRWHECVITAMKFRSACTRVKKLSLQVA